jgi:hypothetical protein
VLERVHLSYCTNLTLAVCLSLLPHISMPVTDSSGHSCIAEQLSTPDTPEFDRGPSLSSGRPHRVLPRSTFRFVYPSF